MKTLYQKHMTITAKEVRSDFIRFVRHEAMRANCLQEDILKIINNGTSDNS